MTTEDTIAALATAPGVAGLAVVRVSGARAVAVADAVFDGRAPLAAAASHTLHVGSARAAALAGDGAAPRGAALDEVVAAVFRASHSYTREDVVELSCHGGALSAARVLEALLSAGARLARPGEFTLRAFLNGRLDLARGGGRGRHPRRDARGPRARGPQLSGGLSRALDALAERAADVLADVEARVDFAEDVGGIEVPPEGIAAIEALAADLAGWLGGSAYARAVREGVAVPIVGRPNAGKSSLFNALLGESRAIVTPVAGSTRDRVSEAIEIAGVRVTLSDTAGLRAPAGAVEREGVARAEAALASAALAIWVVDGSRPLAAEDEALARSFAGKRVLVALNKSDLGEAVALDALAGALAGATHRLVQVSALAGAGLDALRTALAELLGGGDGGGDLGQAVANPRHAEALARARAAFERAAVAGRAGEPGEIVALELREGIAAIGEVTGRNVSEDLLERIFSRFCVGK